MDKERCKCVTSSNEKDFERSVSELLEDGYKIITARYVCYISNFIWYAIMIKEDYE